VSFGEVVPDACPGISCSDWPAVRCIRRNAAAVLSCMASYGGLCISILLHICRIFSDIAGTMAAAKGTAAIECREKREKSDDMALSVVFNECCYG